MSSLNYEDGSPTSHLTSQASFASPWRAQGGARIWNFIASVTPLQYALGATACDLICFGLVATIILIVFSFWYILQTVENTQDWYTVHGAAARAGATALSTLDVAVQAASPCGRKQLCMALPVPG